MSEICEQTRACRFTSINAIKFGKITSEFEGKFCEGCEDSENSGKTTEPHGMGFVSAATHL